MNNGKANARCRGGVWVDHGHLSNCSIRVPGLNQSNQVGEIAAVITAVEKLPNFCPLIIKTDSKYVIEGLTTHLKNWENDGWIGIKNAELFKRAVYLLKRRTAPTWLSWVKGHAGILGNKESDKLAKEGAEKRDTDVLSLDIPTIFDIQGTKLEMLSQAVAYKGIRLQQPAPPRPTMLRNLELTREALSVYSGEWETDKTIWKSMRKRTIRLRVQQFLYKTAHSTQMIGEVWFRVPNHEQRGNCNICDMTESMTHILLYCRTNSVDLIWEMAKDLWPYDPDKWPPMNLGLVLGGKGTSRLLQILVSEAAHLIWVLRCERVIQERTHSPHEIKTRWLNVINKRLTEDKIIATKLVEATWGKVLRKFSDPPYNWIHNREVLVGSIARQTRPIAGDVQ
ncbi:ribonuclease H-like domain-containing protein [Lactarius deliciosus]|nr:ribonuclease H-like domain-containing protein [Lactarius deliciosus]